MPTKTLAHFDEPVETSLVKDLEIVASLVRSHIGKRDNATLALVRIIEGMTQQQWERIRSLHALDQWIGIPLEGDVAQAINAVIHNIHHILFQRDHDSLTGIGNRRLFNTVINREVERALRTSNDLSLIMLDIDNFKQINDTYGHVVGDVVLEELGKLLAETARTYDTAARFGGEEFVLILPAVSALTASIIARRTLKLFSEKTFTAANQKFNVTFSAGVTSVKTVPAPATPQSLLDCADRLLYLAKSRGKNRVCSADIDLADDARSTLVQSAEKQFLFSGNPHTSKKIS